jgi:hypothetical protein
MDTELWMCVFSKSAKNNTKSTFAKPNDNLNTGKPPPGSIYPLFTGYWLHGYWLPGYWLPGYWLLVPS